LHSLPGHVGKGPGLFRLCWHAASWPSCLALQLPSRSGSVCRVFFSHARCERRQVDPRPCSGAIWLRSAAGTSVPGWGSHLLLALTHHARRSLCTCCWWPSGFMAAADPRSPEAWLGRSSCRGLPGSSLLLSQSPAGPSASDGLAESLLASRPARAGPCRAAVPELPGTRPSAPRRRA